MAGVEAEAEQARIHVLEQRVDLARRLDVGAGVRMERHDEAPFATELGGAMHVVEQQPLPPLAEPGFRVRLDGARVAHAVGLAEGVGEQHDGLLTALCGLREHAQRALELAHVRSEALVPAEPERQERPHELHVVPGEQLADVPAAPEVAGGAELGAGIAGVGHRLHECRPVGQPGAADGDLEDAVGDGCGGDARGHWALNTFIRRGLS